MMENFDTKLYNELVNQIKLEHPKLDIEFCKYVAGSYLIYDVMKLEKPEEELEQYKKANEMIEKLSIDDNTIEIVA